MEDHGSYPVTAEIDRRIKAVIAKQFGPDIVERVSVTVDMDHDDDPLLRILVVLRDDEAKLDMKRVLETTRLIRHDLGAIDEWRFPVVTFMTAQEERDVAA